MKELNDFCRKFILKGEHHVTQQDILLYKPRFEKLKASIFESLMLFDTTTFKVYGENVPLAVLINELSIDGLERLIDQNGLSFVLWTPMVGHISDTIPGAIPLVSGRVNSDVHCDPEKSIDLGIACLRNQPNKKQRATIKRKVRDLYIIPKDGLEHESTQFTLSAYNSNKFKAFGLDKDLLDIYSLTSSQKKLISKCAEDLLEYKFIISENLTSLSNSSFYTLFCDTAEKINRLKHTDVVTEITRMENFPNLKEVSLELKNPLRDISKLRNKTNIRKFRTWLDEVTTNCELEDVSKAYIDAIANSKGFFETKKGRFTKNLAMTLIGAGVGSYVGPAGAAIGGVVGNFAEPVVDFGLDLIDEYLISELTRGWTPRMFIDEIKVLQQSK